MADIKNYTLNFGYGRALRALDFAGAKSACADATGVGYGRALCALDFAGAKSACAEIERGSMTSTEVAYG